MSTQQRPALSVVIWLFLGIALVLSMVVIGGMTRLTHSGLSMVHWSFEGSLPPLDDASWEGEFERYQGSPEFQELHGHFSLQDFKSIFWWEYIHRMFGRMIGVVFLLPFLFFLWKKKIRRSQLPGFLLILGLGVVQALLGWYMVQSGLIDVPRVSHFRLAAHLGTAFITCSVIYWVALQYFYKGRMELAKKPLSKHAIAMMLLVFIQIVFGAFVAGLKAGWVHNTFPLMDGQWMHASVLAMKPVWLNFLEGKSGVQFIHRLLGTSIVAYVLILAFQYKSRLFSEFNYLVILAALVILQFTLGILTLVLEVPITLAIAHQVTALVVLLSSIRLVFDQRYRIISN